MEKQSDMEQIKCHVQVINEEVGLLKNDVKWIKFLMISYWIPMAFILLKMAFP